MALTEKSKNQREAQFSQNKARNLLRMCYKAHQVYKTYQMEDVTSQSENEVLNSSSNFFTLLCQGKGICLLCQEILGL